MSKHIKAEWYRITHTQPYFRWYVIVGIIIVIMPVLAFPKAFENDLCTALMNSLGGMGFIMSALLSVITAVMTANIYMSRLHYYEVMDGASVHKIILSKLITHFSVITVFYVLPSCILFGIIYGLNGGGEMKSIPLFFLLYIINMYHLSLRSVLLSIIVRSFNGSTLVSYIPIILELMPYMLLINLMPEHSETIQKIFNFFPTVQLMCLPMPEYTTQFTAAVIIGFIVSMTALYALAYYVYSKTDFK